MKDPKKVKAGKASKAAGGRFELKVRADLEKQGWIVDKWSNNVTLQQENSEEVSGVSTFDGKFIYGKLDKVKNKWLGPGRPVMMGAGFPDFIAFTRRACGLCFVRMGHESTENFNVIGVESKMSGELDRPEKLKCQWLLKNGIFNKILIAQKGEKRGEIIYEDFKEIEGRMQK